MYCSKCGKQVAENASFCPACGSQIRQSSLTAEEYHERKSRIAAGLLGIFLGSIGVHRFYLGYVGIGIAQIIVTIVTLGIGSIWWFIEGILILTGSFQYDAKGIPLRD
ncbi:MAG: TM2 domain-containing protein [Dehalococcoides mccartyi]|nr:TM2 domain-containing protein [Dehalococcoides mccartyi]